MFLTLLCLFGISEVYLSLFLKQCSCPSQQEGLSLVPHFWFT